MRRGTGGPRRKVWSWTKILSPKIRYFVANKDLSRFTHFLEIFGQKKCLFGSKIVFLGQEVHLVYIAYFSELNLQIRDYAQKQRICRENCKYALDESFHGHFCPQQKAAKLQVLLPCWDMTWECLILMTKNIFLVIGGAD